MVVTHSGREGLYLFEATRDGVHLFHLDRRLDFYLECKTELGVRRLRTQRTAAMEEALHEFISEVNGRPYKTNPIEVRSLTSHHHDGLFFIRSTATRPGFHRSKRFPHLFSPLAVAGSSGLKRKRQSRHNLLLPTGLCSAPITNSFSLMWVYEGGRSLPANGDHALATVLQQLPASRLCLAQDQGRSDRS